MRRNALPRFSCTHCKRVFNRPEHLQRHTRSHTGEKPFRCEHCSRTYARKDVLLRHIRNHHDSGQQSIEHPSPLTLNESPLVASNHCDDEIIHNPNDQHSRVSLLPSSENLTGGTPLGSANVDKSNAADFALGIDWSFDLGLDLSSIHDEVQAWTSSFPPDEFATMTETTPYAVQALASSTIREPSLTEQSLKVRRAWPRKNASSVVKMVHRLWEHAIHHPMSNLFHVSPTPNRELHRRSRWGMDSSCRERLIADCGGKFLSAEKYTGGVTAPNSPFVTMATGEDIDVEGLSPHAERSKFPSVETLEMSLDFFFRRSHHIIPFLHKPTFDASVTPSSLLFGLCLAGLSGLNPPGGKAFILEHIGGLMRYCRLDLTYKALGKTGAQPLLTSLASAMVVLFLCLDLGSRVDIHQAHMLAVQMLFIADRHGLFRATGARPLSEAMLNKSNTSYWEAWARVESLKRLIACLVVMDSAITRTLDLAAIMELDRVELMLACPAKLFDSPNEATFSQRLSSPIMPVVGLSEFEPEARDEFAARVQLAYLSLNEAAIRHRMLPNNSHLSSMHFVPAMVYQTDVRANLIIQRLLSLTPACQSTTASLQWNYLCLSMMVDLNRVQSACGKDGITASRRALHDLLQWSDTASARRAVLHAQEIYGLSARHRLVDDKTLCHEMILATAAMVHSLFVLMQRDTDAALNDIGPDLLDWVDVGDAGFPNAAAVVDIQMSTENIAKRFILVAKPVSLLEGQYAIQAARETLLNYAQLLDEVVSSQSEEYSGLLRTIADFVSAFKN